MRLRWFGHVIREGEGSAAYMAYQMARDTSDIGRRVGRPQLTWVAKVKADVGRVELTLARSRMRPALCLQRKLCGMHYKCMRGMGEGLPSLVLSTPTSP